jgi:hypothetical protein
MKFSEKQIDVCVKYLETMAATSSVGFVVGAAGHTTLTTYELYALLVVAVLTFGTALRLRKKS